jgi:hypothetical protein
MTVIIAGIYYLYIYIAFSKLKLVYYVSNRKLGKLIYLKRILLD